MSEANDLYYELSFMSDTGKKMKLKITNAKILDTDEEVATAMDNIIASNVIITKNGCPHSRKGAKLIDPYVIEVPITTA